MGRNQSRRVSASAESPRTGPNRASFVVRVKEQMMSATSAQPEQLLMFSESDFQLNSMLACLDLSGLGARRQQLRVFKK